MTLTMPDPTFEVEQGLQALPLVAGVEGRLLISPRCPNCGWEGGRRPLTSTARWCVAIACSLHLCMAPLRDLKPKRLAA
jgi:hypothetical protein